MERNYLLRKRKAQSEVCRDDKAPTGGASPLIRLAIRPFPLRRTVHLLILYTVS